MGSKFTPGPDARKAEVRPGKPKGYKDFPLYSHPSGHWAKKINGKLYYFGRWGHRKNGQMVRVEGDGWLAALELFKAQRDDLYAGRTPRKGSKGDPTIGLLRDKFLTAKSRALDAGEITSRTYFEYKASALMLVEKFGENRLIDDLVAEDFDQLRLDMAKRWGPVRLSNEIQKVRTIFKYAYEVGLIVNPVRFGPNFKKPSAKILRQQRHKSGPKMLTAAECKKLVDAAPVPLKAMILLGLNCGFGNHDCAMLPLTALDLKGGWVNYPRPKTAIERRCKLWAETVAALQDAIAQRPTPKSEEAEGLVFVTMRGGAWLSGGIANPVSVATRRLMKDAGVHRDGLGHYTLRHIFRTVADGAKDQVAANAIMGHADASMAAVYRERIDDSRLEAVASHVRSWLFDPVK